MKVILILLSIIPIIIVIFFLGLIVVNAQERIQSIPLGYTATLPLGSNDSVIIYNSSNRNYANWGRGYLSFSLAEYWTSTGTSTNMTTIREINVTSSGNIYTCQFGSVSMDYDYEENVKVASYSVICDVTMGENGLQQIKVNHSNGLSNSIVVKTSDYMTFTDNLDIDTTQAINNVTTNMQNYLQTIINNQATYTQSINTTITNIVNSNFATLNSILNNGIDAINGRLDVIIKNGKVCKYYNYSQDTFPVGETNKYLNTSGNLVNDSGSWVTKYIEISPNDYYYYSASNTSQGSYCIYDQSKTLIECHTYQSGNHTIIPSRYGYIRLSFWASLNLTFKGDYCKDGNQAIADQNEEIINSDIDSTDKENVDTTSINNYEDAEADIMDQVGQADLSSLDIGIDSGTSSTIWNLITRIIQSNAKIFGLFISILSIGIIKIALAR